MNGKKSKQLRRLCIGIPKMEHTQIKVDRAEVISTKITGTNKRRRQLSFFKTNLPVNHYKNAKKFYRRTGTAQQAVNRAISFATLLESFKQYKFV